MLGPFGVSLSLKGLKKNCFDVKDSQEILVQAHLQFSFPGLCGEDMKTYFCEYVNEDSEP